PPGAAPTLVSLEDHYKLTLAGELEESNIALDRDNPTSNAIASSLDVNDKLQPNRPVARASAVAPGKRKISLPGGRKFTTGPRSPVRDRHATAVSQRTTTFPSKAVRKRAVMHRDMRLVDTIATKPC
ncbi:MAG: hypothetical protein LQ349_004206, partial [Xanthoria aureola]